MEQQRGFTLVEVVIAVGVVALVAAGAVGAAASARSLAVSTAAHQFDQLLDAARTEAREFPHGVTIAFTKDAFGDGFVGRLYHHRPGAGPLESSTLPALQARVALEETQTLGKPALAIAIHANGTIGGFAGDVTHGANSELNCPDSQHFHFTFAYAGVVVDRYVPCRIKLAATGPVSLITYATATPQPSPSIDVCSSASCAPTAPPKPAVTATCPPNYTATSGGNCLANLLVCSSSPAGTLLGPDADGVHEDVSNGVACSATPPVVHSLSPAPLPSPTATLTVVRATPSPTPSAAIPKIIEVQTWIVYSGAHGFAIQIDGDQFVLLSDGSVSEGATLPGTSWACATQQSVAVPAGPTWAGFFKNPGDSSFAPQYDRMYQEANNTGADGYLSGTDIICP